MKALSTSHDRPPRFRQVLVRELARRCDVNPRYSLRAFAAALEVDHSTLSQLLRDRRAMTERTIRMLGPKVGLSDWEIERQIIRERGVDPWPEADRLTEDVVQLLAEWHHFAILELCRLGQFRADSRWIARALDLEVDEVNLSVQRLARLGLLEMRGERWVDLSEDLYGDIEDLQVAVVRRLATQLGDLSVRRLLDAPPGQRAHADVTLAISRKRVGEALAVIDRCGKELRELFRDEDPDDVYRLEIRFYPVTTLSEKEN